MTEPTLTLRDLRRLREWRMAVMIVPFMLLTITWFVLSLIASGCEVAIDWSSDWVNQRKPELAGPDGYILPEDEA